MESLVTTCRNEKEYLAVYSVHLVSLFKCHET